MFITHGSKVKHKKCSSDSEGCTNLAQNGGVCMRHGAKVKLCISEGCTKLARARGVCIRHGAKVKRCSFEGRANQARAREVCIRHGAKVKRCSSEGCTNQARSGGMCITHGSKVKHKKCSSEDAPTPLKMEAYARGMKERSNYASMKDVQIRQELEEWIV
eukprot:scaffold7272_cov124-Skeletonema_dohrnii-CCMP3373.AAC.10